MIDPLWTAAVIALAVVLDFQFGDPPNRWHPVAWMGTLLTWGRRRLERGSPSGLVARGAVLILTGAAVAGLAGWTLSALTRELGR